MHCPHGADPIGYVVQECHPSQFKCTLANEMEEPQFKIQGPVHTPWSDLIYKYRSLDGSVIVGHTNRRGRCVLSIDHFELSSLVELDVKMKAVLLGACFLGG